MLILAPKSVDKDIKVREYTNKYYEQEYSDGLLVYISINHTDAEIRNDELLDGQWRYYI